MLGSMTSVWVHEGDAAALVRSLKYGGRTGAVTAAADRLAMVVPSSVDVVTWAPASQGSRRRRGFDQAELLARAVAARLGVPCRRLLRRRRGPAQTARGAVGRRAGPDVYASGRLRRGAAVLVVDDVVTTGATLDAAAVALLQRGARVVHGAAVTRAERRSAGTVRARGVPSTGTPDSGGTSWTSPSAPGT